MPGRCCAAALGALCVVVCANCGQWSYRYRWISDRLADQLRGSQGTREVLVHGLQTKLRAQRSTACFVPVGGGGRGDHVVGFPSCQVRSRGATGSVDQILRILVGAQQIARTSQPLAGLVSLCQTFSEVD